jgi:ADP-heptose:LPS heptosyltransferase
MKKPHAPDILLQFLPELGLEAKLQGELKFSISTSDKIKDSLYNERQERCKLILVFPESSRKKKEWPYFGQLSEILAEKFCNMRIAILVQRWVKNRMLLLQTI